METQGKLGGEARKRQVTGRGRKCLTRTAGGARGPEAGAEAFALSPAAPAPEFIPLLGPAVSGAQEIPERA